MLSRISLFLVGIFFYFPATAQEIVVHGRFLTDSIKIGEPVAYSLSVRHPASQPVVFPDTAFSFSPFEMRDKKYFPTRTQDQVSIDSALYFLNTFEIDSLQSLALPVFVIHKKDCTAVFAPADTVVLKQLVGKIPESVAAKDLPLKTNADYLNVKWLLNYPLLLLIAGILILILVVVWIVFGRKIKKYFLLRRLARKHFTFLDRFAQQLEKMRKASSPEAAESALVIWKRYLEGLLAKPYTKFTTKEILQQGGNEKLSDALHRIDRIVYARDSAFREEAFNQLRSFSEEQFTRRVKEVKHE